MTRRRLAGDRPQVDVDPMSGRASGPNKVIFASYLGTLARDKISILVPSWDDVTESVKNMIWQDILVFSLILHVMLVLCI